MKQSIGARYAPGYDLFKLIVAVLLTILLIFLLLRENQLEYASLELKSTEMALLPTPSPRAPLPTSTPPATQAATEVSTPSQAPVTTTAVPKETPTEQPPAVETPAPQDGQSNQPVNCPSNPTRIQNGDNVRVLDWLNFRLGPGLNYPIQNTNKPGTEMAVIGGPVCTIKADHPPRGYLWWNVKTKDGREGWSAEAPLNFPNYFLEPVR